MNSTHDSRYRDPCETQSHILMTLSQTSASEAWRPSSGGLWDWGATGTRFLHWNCHFHCNFDAWERNEKFNM